MKKYMDLYQTFQLLRILRKVLYFPLILFYGCKKKHTIIIKIPILSFVRF